MTWSYPDCHPIRKRKVPIRWTKVFLNFISCKSRFCLSYMTSTFFLFFFFFFFLILFWWIVNESLSFFYQLLLDSDLSTRFASWLWVAFGHSPINSEKKGRVFLDEFIDMIAYLYGLYAEATRYSGFAFEILLKIIIHWKLKTIKLFSIIVWILLCINYSLKMWKFFSITF